MSKIQITDRYSATGTPYPDKNSCDECDAMGLYPCEADKLNEEACKTEDSRLLIIGQKDKDGNPMPFDGWLFVQCPVCKGSRGNTKATDMSGEH